MLSIFNTNSENKSWLIPLTVLFIAVNLFWGFYSNNTWDDDCQTRFFNATNALNDPSHFLSIWNRPLFMLIFSIPAQMGHWTIIVLQTIFSVFTGWSLVKAAEKLNLKHAFLAFPFLVFQPFVFGVSRYAMTEPLAVLLISLSLYFLTHKKWLAFAIAGSLIPLARLELTVLLPFWLIPLIKNNRIKETFILVIPLLIWMIAGGLYHENMNWFFEQTLAKESVENRYGHKNFSTYFERYQYVVGPVLFFLAWIGIPKIGSDKNIRKIILWPFFCGLIMYSIFSSTLNMGNAAGFLRNLIPLSPYLVLLALIGFNHWISNTINQNTQELTSSAKSIQKNQRVILILGGVSLALTGIFYSYELEAHHLLNKENFYGGLLICQILMFSLLFLSFNLRFNKHPKIIALTCLTILTSYTLINEHPLANSNSEREIVSKTAELYNLAELKQHKTYANHPWFFWASGLNKKKEEISTITKKNLNSAKPGSIAVVENHYSNRLGGDIDMNYFVNHPEWIEISSLNTPEKDFFISIYQKSKGKSEHLKRLNKYISASNHKDGSALLLKGLYFLNEEKNTSKAIATIELAFKADSTLFKTPLTLGKIHLRNKNYPSALKAFKQALKIDPSSIEMHERIGTLYFNLGKLNNANRHFSFIVRKMTPSEAEPKPSDIFISAKRNLAICNFQQKQYRPAFKHFNEIVRYQKDVAQDHYNISKIYQISKKKESACKALNKAYEMGMTDVKNEIKSYCK